MLFLMYREVQRYGHLPCTGLGAYIGDKRLNITSRNIVAYLFEASRARRRRCYINVYATFLRRDARG